MTDNLKSDISTAIQEYNSARHPNGLSSYIQAGLGADSSKLLFTDSTLFLFTAQQIVNLTQDNTSLHLLHTNLYSFCSNAWLYHDTGTTYGIPNVFNESIASLYVYILNNVHIDLDYKLACLYQLICNELGQEKSSTHAFMQIYPFLCEHDMLLPWLGAECDSDDYQNAYYNCFTKLYSSKLVSAGLALNLTPHSFVEYAVVQAQAGLDVNPHPLDFSL